MLFLEPLDLVGVDLVGAETTEEAVETLDGVGKGFPALGNAFLPSRFQNHLEQMRDCMISDPPSHFL